MPPPNAAPLAVSAPAPTPATPAFARGGAMFLKEVWTGSGPGAAGATALVALGAAVEASGLLILTPVLQLALATGEARSIGWMRYFESRLGPERTVGAVLAVFVVMMLVRSLILWRRDVILAKRQTSFLESRRLAVAQGLAAASWPTVSRLGHGRVAHVMGGDMARITAGAHFAVQGAVAAVTLVALAIVALSTAPRPAAMALGLMALAAWAMARLTRRARDAGARMADSNRSLTTGVGAFLRGMKAAKSQDLQQPFVAGFQRDLAAAGRAQVAFLSEQAQVRAIWPLVAVATLGAVVTAGAVTGERDGAAVLVLVFVLWRMVGPAAQLQSGVQQVAFALPAWEAIRDLETELAAGVEATGPDAGEPPPGAVELRGVTVLHGDGGGVTDVDLRLAPGSWLGLAGPAGSGKTTLADVIAGLREPDSGEILIGGRPLDGTMRAAWRRSLAYVPQDPFLLDDSVRANLAWSRPEVDEAAMIRALETVGVAARLARLPGGLDGRVGENGALISGGERQRLALARALLRRPRLLILDEATNAVDLDGEARLLAAVRAASPGMSVILIAHRRETLAVCDTVLRLEAGRVAPAHMERVS